MNIYLAPSFVRSQRKIIRKNPNLEKKIQDKIKIFRENPGHPSLALHKLTGSLHETWSFSIIEDLRVLFTYTEGGVIFVDIGKHEDIY